MPLYDYQCDKCSSTVTDLRQMKQRHDPLPCPKCGAKTRLALSTFSTTKHSSATTKGGVVQHTTTTPPADRASMRLHNVHMANWDVGISMPKGTSIEMQNVTFDNVNKPVELREQ